MCGGGRAAPKREACGWRAAGGSWKSLTWEESGELVRQYAAGLLALGLARARRVRIAASPPHGWIPAGPATLFSVPPPALAPPRQAGATRRPQWRLAPTTGQGNGLTIGC